MAIKKWIHLAEPWASTVHLNCFVTCTLQLNFCSFLMVLHNTLAYSVDKSCLTLRPFELYPSKFPCPWDFQSRILEWIAISFSRSSSWPRDETRISCIAGGLYHWATREAPTSVIHRQKVKPIFPDPSIPGSKRLKPLKEMQETLLSLDLGRDLLLEAERTGKKGCIPERRRESSWEQDPAWK